MSPLALGVTHILSFSALFGAALFIFLLLVVCIKKLRQSAGVRPVVQFFTDHATLFSFLVALGGTMSSLFYSEFVGFIPCILCWYQRIVLYPQTLLLGIALKKKDPTIIKNYTILLSIIGFGIAVYHVYLQFGGAPLIPCAANGGFCGQRFFVEFGYVTIPTMSLTAFGLLILFALLKKEE